MTLFYHAMQRHNTIYLKILVAVIFLSINLFLWSFQIRNSQGELIVSFLDVGQGDAIFIEAPNGNQILIDGGRNKNILKELSKLMSFFDRTIDVVVASHPDTDHIGGLPAVLDRYKVSYVMESGNQSDSAIFLDFKNAIIENGSKRLLAENGMEIDLGSGVVLSILYPDRDVSLLESNESSIVAKLVFGKTEVMLTGDAPKYIEYHLVSKNIPLESDILKVGHHGSKTSTLPSFLEAVSPKIAIISAGIKNSYGHPSEDVMDLLKGFAKLSILETSKEGTITFVSRGEEFERK